MGDVKDGRGRRALIPKFSFGLVRLLVIVHHSADDDQEGRAWQNLITLPSSAGRTGLTGALP